VDELHGAAQRLERLGLFFVAAFFVLSGLLVYWQVIRATNLVNRPDDPRLYAAQLAVHRGMIIDRRGSRLARTVFEQADPVRRLTDPSLSLLIGYHSLRYDNSGLEGAYNDYLNGAGRNQPLDNVVRGLLHQSQLGDTLQLTIDDRIQQLADQALGDGEGVALVADPRTGQILAMVSKPGFDAGLIDQPGYWDSLQVPGSPLLNRAIEGRYTPGSIFKTVTLATALSSGGYRLGSVFSGQDATGPLYVDGSLIHASASNLPDGLGSVTLKEAFKYSDNIAFAVTGLHLGARALLDGAHAFGFDQDIPFDLPVTRSTVTEDLNGFSRFQIATSAFGQGTVQVTPLQMLLADEAVANGGTIMSPYVVKRITAPNGEVLLDRQPRAWLDALSPQVARGVGEAMLSVVNDPGGSGYLARLPGVQVAGKTGTAQVDTPGALPHAWFMAYAPADHPRLAVVVLKVHGGEGATAAVPIAAQILAGALPLYH